MTSIPRFSPGRFTALWLVLRSVSRLGDGVGKEDLLAFAGRSALRAGGLPISDGYDLAVFGGFLTAGDQAHLTALGRNALARGQEDEPSPEVLQCFASVLFLRRPPPWVAYWQGDMSTLDIVLPEPSREILREAELLGEPSVEDLEAWAWWDALRYVPPQEESAGNRKAIGDSAEELSLFYESQRLTTEGFPELARRIRWVARESAAYGFDILSFCGTSHDPVKPRDPLAIEVKGMGVVARKVFRFYVTQHEWKTARTLATRHVFHFWDGVHPGTDKRASREAPMVASFIALAKHLPGSPECSEECCWESSLLIVPTSSLSRGR